MNKPSQKVRAAAALIGKAVTQLARKDKRDFKITYLTKLQGEIAHIAAVLAAELR